MGLYAVSGAATGIGAGIAEALRARGDTVLGVDIQRADVVADLASEAGRAHAARAVRERAADGLDGLVLAAGVGPHVPDATLIARVNFFGVVRLLEALEDLLTKKRGAALLIASERAFHPGYDAAYLNALHAGDEAGACARITALAEPLRGDTAYGGGKCALVRWMRHKSVSLARARVRINAVAPGYIETPLTEAAKASPLRAALEQFVASIPLGRPGVPRDVANAAMFLLSPQAEWITGSTLHIDGGHDAVQRPDRVG